MTPAALSATHHAAFADQRGWSAKEFGQLLGQRGVILCGDAKSFVLGRVIADEAEVLTLATHPEFVRQGRATKALQQFLNDARSQGATRVFLEVADTNYSAKALYIKSNFTVIGHRPKYYKGSDGAWVDAILMEAPLFRT